MIKLFWNTHNQIPPKPNDISSETARNYKWGLYHKNNSDKWIYQILNKIEFKVIENEKNLETDDTLIIIDSSIEKKSELYSRLKLICSQIFLVHLGDEAGITNINFIYDNCTYIWRTFCSNRYFNNQKVGCIPIGYKSGLIYKNELSERKYKWAFIGTPHKSSRHDLLFQLSNIAPSFSYKTKKFDEKVMEIKEMSEILSSTEFVPCPNGFVHPETYRIYEALECGNIPIVENTYKYYDRLFPGNPFLKINKWKEAKSIIEKWEKGKIKEKSEECKLWWKNQKNKIQSSVKKKLTDEQK